MSKKLKLLSILMGAASSLQMLLPLSVFAADSKEQNENNVMPETTENFSIPGVDEQNVNQLNEDGYAPLHLQIAEDNLEKIIFLVSLGADISIKDKNGDTPLHTAAREDAIECLSYLISRGADIDARNIQGETPLMLAAKEGNRLSFFTLLGDWLKERRADINVIDDKNNNVLHCLAGSDMDGLISLLLLAEKEDNLLPLVKMINRKNNAGETPIFNAIRSKNEDVAMFLIKNGATVDDKNNFGQTQLMLAAQRRLKNLVKKFVEQGADVKSQDNLGNTLLHYMARNWDSSLNEIFSSPENVKSVDRPFMKLREMIDVANKKGETPLFVTAENNQLELAEILIKNGAQVNFHNNVGQTALHMAVRHNSFEVAKMLIERGVNINDKVGLLCWETPLHLAVENNSFDLVKLLIESGADIKGDIGKSLFKKAVMKNSVDVVKLLIDKGVSVDSKYDNEKTPLLIAVQSNSFEVAKILIEKGAAVDAKYIDEESRTSELDQLFYLEVMPMLEIKGSLSYIPFFHKIKVDGVPVFNSIRAMKLLINKGKVGNSQLREVMLKDKKDLDKLLIDKISKIKVEDSWGKTSLHEAIDIENFKIAKLLIENGANVKAKDCFGKTPLHLIAEKNMGFEVAKLLIENGAELGSRDDSNRTPYDVAQCSENLEFVKLLNTTQMQFRLLNFLLD